MEDSLVQEWPLGLIPLWPCPLLGLGSLYQLPPCHFPVDPQLTLLPFLLPLCASRPLFRKGWGTRWNENRCEGVPLSPSPPPPHLL